MHDHAHSPSGSAPQSKARVNRRPLAIALGITATFLVIEVIGGIATSSLALLADAGHMATDVAALALSLLAIWLAARPATPERSFGFHRAEILAALANSSMLIVISGYIFWEAFHRLRQPPEVNSGPMLVVAIAGLAANAVSAWVLMRGGGHQENLNTRGAYLHVVGDMLGSVGAILAAIVMLLTGWYLADPILSAGIGLLVLWNSWKLLRESVDVLLEATPASVDPLRLRQALEAVAGVDGVHDLHVWTVTSGLIAMSAHIEVADLDDWSQVLDALRDRAREPFGIYHVTLQPEVVPPGATVLDRCTFDTPEGIAACLV